MKTLQSVIAAACLSVVITGCGPAVSEAEQAAHEAAMIESAPAVPEPTTRPTEAAAGSAFDAILKPREWSPAAKAKACSYAEALLDDAENGAVILPEGARKTAERVRQHC